MMEQDDQTVLDVIVAATAVTAFSVSQSADRQGGQYLAEALSVDMANWWTPSLDGFISRIKKAELARALHDAALPDEATRIEKMKKAETTATAARAMGGNR